MFMISTAPGTSLYTDKTTTRSSEGFLRSCGPFYIRLPSHTSCPARRRTISRPARQSTVRRRTISRPPQHSTTCHPPRRRPDSPPCPRLNIIPSLPDSPPHQQLKSIPSPSTDTPCPRLNILQTLPGSLTCQQLSILPSPSTDTPCPRLSILPSLPDSPPFAGTLCSSSG